MYRKPSGKCTQLIILGAGSESGWIPNSTLILKSKRNTSNYHDEMASEHFEEWFSKSLIPNVQTNSRIVMDNATYHSRRSEPLPVKSWTKKRMIEWLQVKWVQYYKKAINSDIFAIIQRQKPTARYVVDEMAAAKGK